MQRSTLFGKAQRQLLATLPALALAACGGGNGGDRPADLAEACEVLPPSAVASLAGGSFEITGRDLREDDDGRYWMSMCTYYAEDAGTSISLMIRPTSPRGDAAAAYEEFLRSMRSGMDGGGAEAIEDIDGIGHRAGWMGGMGQLTAIDDDYALIISVAGSGNEAPAKRDIASRLATATFDRL